MIDIELLLRNTKLFDGLSPAELENVSQAAEYVTLPSNWKIINEGDTGAEFFVVVEGSLQVFTQKQDGSEIVLAKLGKGAYVGEQALLHGLKGRRNASVRTAEPSTLLRINEQYLQFALDKDMQLGQRLLKTGDKQVEEKLLKQSSLFQAFSFEGRSDWRREVSFASGEVIFNEGDAGDHFYLILKGSVLVYQQFSEQQKMLARLETGQGFGEIALLRQSPRRATVVAEEDVLLLQVDGDAFREQFQKEPELRDYFQTLQKVYSLSDQGVATQHLGKFLGHDCITMVFHLDGDRTAISSQVIGQNIVSMQIASTAEEGQQQKLRYTNAKLQVEREIVLNNNVLVNVIAHGAWMELGRIQRMILEQVRLTEDQIQRFHESGDFFKENQKVTVNEESICCECMQVSFGTVLETVNKGYHSVEEVADLTGCTTVCGTCRSQVREILGEGGWTPVMVTEEFEIVPGIRSFRFSPYGPHFKPALPGQHVVLKAAIDGNWVLRPYTITSAANEMATREVTIKRETHGYFSNWIFDQRKPDTILQVSEPQGDYFVDLAEPEPIICLAAGIGVTPALAIMRTILDEQKSQTLHIDYSARTEEEFIYREQLEEVAKKHKHIHVNLRNTQKEGRITPEDVKQLTLKYPDARIYICGPGAFQVAVQNYLHEIDFRQDRIHVEEFTPVGGIAKKITPREWLVSKSYLPIGLVLLGLFVVQDVFQLKWPLLEAVQATEVLKRWTGLFLTAFILLQWYLPYLRWRSKLKAAASQYHWHKLLGAFSPLVYYMHSTKFGFAFLFLLSLVYFANFVLGLFNQEIFPDSPYKKTFGYYWLIAHIILSVSMVSLIIYHIYIAFAYQ